MPIAAKYYFTVLSLGAVIFLAGCSHEPEPAAAKRPEGHTIGVSLASLKGAWREQMKVEIEEAAKTAKVNLIVMDAQDDVARQTSQLEELRAKKVDAVIVSPKTTQAITSPAARFYDAGVPVIVLDRSLLGGKYTCFIAADPVRIGTAAGRWVAEKLNGKGKIVEILAPVDSAWSGQLYDAWRAELRDPGYRFMFSGHVDPPNIDAKKLMTEALAKTEKIDVVFAYDDADAYAAYGVAKAAKREKGTLFVGIGGLKTEGAEYVKQGILDASILFPIGGTEAVDVALKALRGEKLPKKIMPEPKVITKGN